MEEHEANGRGSLAESHTAIAELLERVGAQKQTFLAIIDCCREERRADDIDKHIAPLLEYRKSVYTPDVMRSLLVKCGALSYVEGDKQPGQNESPAEDAENGAIPASQRDVVPAFDGSVGLVLPERPEDAWIATPEAVAYLDGLDPMADLAGMLEDDARYTGIYQRILAFCTEGRSASEIANLVDDDPLLEKPRRLSGYFVGKLEDAGALVWKGRWQTTETGKALINGKGASL